MGEGQVNNDMNNTQKLLSKLVDKLVDSLAIKSVDFATHAEVSLIPNSDTILGIPEGHSPLVPHPQLDRKVQEQLREGIPLDQLEGSHMHFLGHWAYAEEEAR